MGYECCKCCVAPKRYPGCQDHCPEYKNERHIYEQRKKEYYGDHTVRQGLIGQRAASVARAERAKR